MGVAFLTSCRGKLKIVAPPSMAVGENSEPVGVVGLAPCNLLFCSSSCSFSSLAIVIFSKSPLLKYFFPPYCKTNYTFQLIPFTLSMFFSANSCLFLFCSSRSIFKASIIIKIMLIRCVGVQGRGSSVALFTARRKQARPLTAAAVVVVIKREWSPRSVGSVLLVVVPTGSLMKGKLRIE